MKEFHGEYKGEALATVNSTNTAAAVGFLFLQLR